MMSIKFNFTVSDIDAENILNAIRQYALQNDIEMMDVIASTILTREEKDAKIESFRADKQYILGLIEKMKVGHKYIPD